MKYLIYRGRVGGLMRLKFLKESALFAFLVLMSTPSYPAPKLVESNDELCQRFHRGFVESISRLQKKGVSKEYIRLRPDDFQKFKIRDWKDKVVNIEGVDGRSVKIHLQELKVDINNDDDLDFLVRKPSSTKWGDSHNVYFYSYGAAYDSNVNVIPSSLLSEAAKIDWFKNNWAIENGEPVGPSEVDVVSYKRKNYLLFFESTFSRYFLVDISKEIEWVHSENVLSKLNLVCAIDY